MRRTQIQIIIQQLENAKRGNMPPLMKRQRHNAYKAKIPLTYIRKILHNTSQYISIKLNIQIIKTSFDDNFDIFGKKTITDWE